jgi:hypothetical protein
MALRVPTVLLAVLLPGYGQAAETETAVLTLSCDGTQYFNKREGNKTWPITKMGLHVNLSGRTITGFTIDARISKISGASIEFEKADGLGRDYFLRGSIDRITGKLYANFAFLGDESEYLLLCKPTKPLF